MTSLQGFIILAVACAITFAIGWIICWLIDFFGAPAELGKVLKIVVWLIVAAIIVLRLLTFAGIH